MKDDGEEDTLKRRAYQPYTHVHVQYASEKNFHTVSRNRDNAV